MTNKFSAIKVAIPLIILSTQAPLAYGADSITVDSAGGLELSITANRRPLAIDKTLASVTVITRKQLENTQANDLVDVLRLQRGINISRTGGSGSNTSVFIRGSESDQVLVLLDGVRVSSATTGAFNWAEMPVDMVESIEIVRGPRAALYGSDAIGGVIEIRTRKNTKHHISLTAGEYNTKRANAGFSSDFGKNHVSLNLATEESSGFSSTNKKAGQFVYNPDKDPYRKNSVSASISRQFTNKTKASFSIFQNKTKTDYDQGVSDSKLQTLSLTLDANVSDRWSHKLSLSQTRDELESTSSFGVSNFDTKRRELNWQNNLNLSTSTNVILGANYREDKGKSADFNKKIDNKAIYANINNKRGALNLDASVRYDKHSQAGGKATGQLAVGYDISAKATAYASYGTAFKAPNINELYYPGFLGSYAGNPRLKPETSKTFEVGLKSQITANQRAEVSLYQTDVKNLISYAGEKNQAINSDKVMIKGLELGYAATLNKLDLGIDLSLLKTEDKVTGNRLLRRPDSKITLNLGYALSDKTHLGLDASVVGSRSDKDFSGFPSKRTTLKKYTLLNLSVKQKLGKHAKIGLRLDNITDEKYELAHGYNTPRRGAFITFSYNR